MALQNFRWENGTSQHPVELNQSQLNNLLKLALRENIVSDVRGHITTSSGLITRYTKWQLEQKYEHLVIHAQEVADTLSIVPVRSTINEGERTNITVTGMTASSVKFRIQHSFRNVYGISQSAAQARIHMEGNTLIVDEPEENASWIDDVTIQAIPIYEEWSNPETIASCTVTVTAKELTGIVLTAPSACVLGETFGVDVTLVPSTNTKGGHVTLDAECVSDGLLTVRKPTVQGTTVYTSAPAEECNLTLTVNAYMFGDLQTVAFTDMVSGIHTMNSYIQFVITTEGTFSDITEANIKIHLQKLDSEDEPVELTGTVTGDSLVFEYGGGNVAGNGIESWRVTVDSVLGYRVTYDSIITPNGVANVYELSYLVVEPDVYMVYSDGTEQPYDDYDVNGVLQGRTPVCVLLVTGYGSIYLREAPGGARKYSDDNSVNVNIVSTDTDTYNGEENTRRLEAKLSAYTDPDVYVIPYVRSKTFVLNGVTMQGYVLSIKECYDVRNNRDKIDLLRYEIGFLDVITGEDVSRWTSTRAADNGNMYSLAQTFGQRTSTRNGNNYPLIGYAPVASN